jgi:hypothetical protein
MASFWHDEMVRSSNVMTGKGKKLDLVKSWLWQKFKGKSKMEWVPMLAAECG